MFRLKFWCPHSYRTVLWSLGNGHVHKYQLPMLQTWKLQKLIFGCSYPNIFWILMKFSEMMHNMKIYLCDLEILKKNHSGARYDTKLTMLTLYLFLVFKRFFLSSMSRSVTTSISIDMIFFFENSDNVASCTIKWYLFNKVFC